MKKLIIISLLFVGIAGIRAQSAFALTDGVPALVYALPKTNLCFEIEVETTVEKPGVFYLYSQRYLATSQVVMEEKTSSKVKSISMQTVTVPDVNRRFAVEPMAKSPLNGIVVNEQGILCGVNIVPASPSAAKTDVSNMQKQEVAGSEPELLSLTQEYMMAGSTAKMAEGAAKQIYDIRASRLNLLSGEMDHLPDGEALKTMLSGLDAKEKELTALFIGSVRKNTKVYKLNLSPDNVVSNEVLFRLSATRGVVAKDDLSGEPYFITIAPEKIRMQERDPKAKVERAGLYTVLPALTTVTVSDGVNQVLQQTIPMPQFGQLVTLPESLLRTPGIKITVDVPTGRILGIIIPRQ